MFAPLYPIFRDERHMYAQEDPQIGMDHRNSIFFPFNITNEYFSNDPPPSPSSQILMSSKRTPPIINSTALAPFA